MSRASEVTFGEAQEKRILLRWLQAKGIKPDAVRVVGSRQFQDWDFLLLDAEGYPLTYVEIKARRSSLTKYGDCIAPIRKHAAAVKLAERNIEFYLVTEYPDALVQVNLASPPSQQRNIRRRDRPGDKPVPHGIWAEGQLEVVEGDE